MVARERAHVLDHAGDAQEAAAGHVGGADRDLLGAHGRGGDDDQVGARHHARETHLHVAGAGRHVDEQVVEVAPLHVAKELLDGLA